MEQGQIALEVELRDTKEIGRAAVAHLRREGYIPAVIYSGGKESHPVKIVRHDFLHLLHEYRLENAIINVSIKGVKGSKPRSCLIKEMQHDPVNEEIVHVDFNEVSLTKTIKVNVSVSAKGEAIGVRNEGGSLEQILWEIEVECLPMDIPKEITVDVTNLKLGESIEVKDLVVSAKVKILAAPESSVFTVAHPIKEEAPVEAVEGEEKKEPEVIKEKKEVPEEKEEKDKKDKK